MTRGKVACQNCKKEFIIEPEDFAFYEKIQVPPPTRCPTCRRVRRMLWRNERNLYKRKDSRTGDIIFSQFPPESRVQVYDVEFWKSDSWNPLKYGRDYDFSKPLFAQFDELLRTVPLMSRFIVGTFVNSDYCMNGTDLRDCYLVFATTGGESCMYSVTATYCKECVDIYSYSHCELCYECIFCSKCYNTKFSSNCESCEDTWFSRDCIGCTNCFGCANLRNRSYCIFNEQLVKDEYKRRLSRFSLNSLSGLLTMRSTAVEKINALPKKYMIEMHNAGVSGNMVFNSKNAFDAYRVWGAEDCKYCQDLVSPTSKSCCDINSYGQNLEMAYECVTVGNDSARLRFCQQCEAGSTDVSYSVACRGSSNIFGCVGLRNKSYCILNKQYSKEEYEKMVPKIIDHMNAMPYIDAKGRIYKYGEFFPPDLSPFAYNETIAQEYFPLTKEEAVSQGYRWKDPEEKNYQITKQSGDLPDHIKDVDDSILKETIECAHNQTCNEQCTQAFKIIPEELSFYRRMNLPLPHLCPNCRHYERLKQRNPLNLWHRKCQCVGAKSENGIYQNTGKHQHGEGHCPNEFETSYAPERKEIVYCENCYQSEVV